MSHGNTSGGKCEPNFTPLLDLVLQLVMFFMLCAKIVVDQTGVEVKLPKANSAKALEKDAAELIFLNINKDGHVVFPPNARPTDSQGKEVTVVTNAQDLEKILSRRAEEDRERQRYLAKQDGKPPPAEPVIPQAVIILRIDKRCQFEQTAPLIDAVRMAGFRKVKMRALLASEGGGPDDE